MTGHVMDFQELVHTLTVQAGQRRDYVVPATKVFAEVTTAPVASTDNVLADVITATEQRTYEMRLDNGVQFNGNDNFHAQAAVKLKIPKPFYDRLRAEHPDAFRMTFNSIIHKECKDSKYMIRMHGDMARAMLSDRYRRLDNYELMNHAILPVLKDIMDSGTALNIASCSVTDDFLHMKVVVPGLQREVKRGDTVSAGFYVRNSEVGKSSFTVAPFVLRLVCANGMVVDAMKNRSYHVGRANAEDMSAYYKGDTLAADDRAFMLKVRDTIGGCITEAGFDNIVGKMRAAAEERIEEPQEIVQLTAEKFNFTQDESTLITKALMMGEDMTRWGLVNAITATARDMARTDYDRATELESIGSKVLFQ